MVLVSEIAKGKLNPDKPESFLGYRQTLDLLKLPPDAPLGETDGQTLQLNGLNDLAAWIDQNPKRLPRITGLTVAKEPRVYPDGTRRSAHVPGKGYFLAHKRKVEDWQWWLAEARKSIAFDWSPYLPAEETVEPAEIRHVGGISKGAEREVPAKLRQRSKKLRDLSRAPVFAEAEKALGKVESPKITQCPISRDEQRRKYGQGGEGVAHKALKLYVAEHPELLELGKIAEVVIEHPFPSGNRVDLLVRLTNGRDAVVEIETTVPLPGCHQAIMYRTLRTVELKKPLIDDGVSAILVAHGFDAETNGVAARYNVRLIGMKAPN